MEKMYFGDREIVLEEQWDDVEYSCEGCVLDGIIDGCVKHISPPQDNTVCCPRGTNEMYIFKYAQDELIAEEV